MPLPSPNTAWPPAEVASAHARFADYDAWYAGDPDRLAKRYSGRRAPRDHPSQHRRGLVGRLARWWWGEPTSGSRRAGVHCPLAADIATASSDLLFAKPPTIKFRDRRNQAHWDRLDDLAQVHSRLHESAEVASALGGVYLRVGWDERVARHALLQVVHADRAIPVFSWGRLVEVTFWTELAGGRDGQVWRYLQHHEMRGEATQVAVEENALYLGTETSLGEPRPLDQHPATAGIEPVVARGLPVLPVAYIPNMLPSREDRGSDLGRSDYEGVMQLFDAVDETLTSWMRDVRHAKGRIIVPSAYLQDMGPGQGAAWDSEREVYESLNIPPTTAGGNTITLHQFEIRVEEHDRTLLRLIRQAIGTAGYSPATFGLEEQGGEQTATEVNDRRNRSLLTREKKTAYYGDGLQHIAVALLWVERIIFGADVAPQGDVPHVQWPDGVSVDQLRLAQTVEAWDRARAASTETKVKALHP
ncbi:phage portal protein, partial [Actinosynnema sp.]|uniref:phage portal protein n=1 Tax=Actinosynnema sp. TaxID=1872144 RepID=UPI003F84CC54